MQQNLRDLFYFPCLFCWNAGPLREQNNELRSNLKILDSVCVDIHMPGLKLESCNIHSKSGALVTIHAVFGLHPHTSQLAVSRNVSCPTCTSTFVYGLYSLITKS